MVLLVVLGGFGWFRVLVTALVLNAKKYFAVRGKTER